jgi:hypothetical protein
MPWATPRKTLTPPALPPVSSSHRIPLSLPLLVSSFARTVPLHTAPAPPSPHVTFLFEIGTLFSSWRGSLVSARSETLTRRRGIAPDTSWFFPPRSLVLRLCNSSWNLGFRHPR